MLENVHNEQQEAAGGVASVMLGAPGLPASVLPGPATVTEAPAGSDGAPVESGAAAPGVRR